MLIVGSGGREHALAWKLEPERRAPELHAAPGQPRDRALGDCHPVRAEDAEGLLALAQALEIDLAVDRAGGAARRRRRRRAAARTASPSSARARRPRGSRGRRASPRTCMRGGRRPDRAHAAGRPTALRGQGRRARRRQGRVRLPNRRRSSTQASRAAAALGGPLVIEELLEGEEVSVFALCDGPQRRRSPAAQDYKRAGDGDTGPEHRRHGRLLAGPGLDAGEVDELVDPIHRPVLAELAAARHAVRRRPLRGPDADGRRAARARVQLPLRRPRDAGRSCRGSRATCSTRSPPPPRRPGAASRSRRPSAPR